MGLIARLIRGSGKELPGIHIVACNPRDSSRCVGRHTTCERAVRPLGADRTAQIARRAGVESRLHIE